MIAVFVRRYGKPKKLLVDDGLIADSPLLAFLFRPLDDLRVKPNRHMLALSGLPVRRAASPWHLDAKLLLYGGSAGRRGHPLRQ